MNQKVMKIGLIMRRCKRCLISIDKKRKDAQFCSRKCKDIFKACVKSKKKTLHKWKQNEIKVINVITSTG